jgi:hypothetical protein
VTSTTVINNNGRVVATTASPCPVCLGDHGCSVGSDGLIFCRRSSGAAPGFAYLGQAKKDPQWALYRRTDDDAPKTAHLGGDSKPRIDWDERHACCERDLTPALRAELAATLGLPAEAVRALGAGWWGRESCWTFPERDGAGKIVNLLRRYRDGTKRAMPGGARGIVTPSGWAERDGPVLAVEGPSDTGALWATGLRPLGRPSNRGGLKHLAVALGGLPAMTDIIIVGENDTKRDGSWPGMAGARDTAAELTRLLGREVLWALPPGGHKDVREWVLARRLGAADPDAWYAAGGELLADLRENAVSVPALYRGNTEFSPPFALIPCSQLHAVAEDVLWCWPGYLARGAVTLVSAYMKSGKTTLLAHLLKALGPGGPFLGREAKPSRVLYVTEEQESRWAERRDKLGLGDHVAFVVRPFRAKPDREQWGAFLDHLRGAQRREQFDVIIFDTISNLWPVRDENSAPEVQEALMPLHGVIGDAALVLVHHLRKSDGHEGTGSRGSGALLAWVDVIVELRRFDAADHKSTQRVITGYGRYDQTPAQLVIDLGENGYAAEGDRAEVRAGDVNTALAEVMPAEPPGRSVDEMLQEWPREAKPNRNELFAALRRGCEEERWSRTGGGKKGDPYRYHRNGISTAPLYTFPVIVSRCIMGRR